MATNAYIPLATTTLNGSTAGVTFSSIPQTYTDLIIVATVRTTEAVVQNGAYIKLNSFTGSNSASNLSGNTSSALSGRNTNTEYGWVGQMNGANATAGEFTTIIANLNNYTNANTYKTILTRSNCPTYGTYEFVTMFQTTSAITSLSFVASGLNNWANGSTISLYGILKA